MWSRDATSYEDHDSSLLPTNQHLGAYACDARCALFLASHLTLQATSQRSRCRVVSKGRQRLPFAAKLTLMTVWLLEWVSGCLELTASMASQSVRETLYFEARSE